MVLKMHTISIKNTKEDGDFMNTKYLSFSKRAQWVIRRTEGLFSERKKKG